ncbi:MAG: glucosaminidase domain-containing protein, partial [Microthrixaceae bacterium]|nr:glucosaminidase domain-containing protein [Microthrixaceae bacterium]
MKRPPLSAVVAAAVLCAIASLTALPILSISLTAAPSTACGDDVAPTEDGTPSILGPSPLTVADLRAWWASTGRAQPARLGIAIDDLLALYISEGAAEGVRGDMALAQAVLETGHFTNSDTARHNYAGIAHYDGSASGVPFASPLIGVRA